MLLQYWTYHLIPNHLRIQLIRELHSVTETSANGEDQSQKGTQLLEIYALEIQMHNETKNYKKLKARSCLKTQCVLRCELFSGNLQCFQQHSFRDTASTHHGYHQRVRWENVDG
jgi:hypothetical protein